MSLVSYGTELYNVSYLSENMSAMLVETLLPSIVHSVKLLLHRCLSDSRDEK